VIKHSTRALRLSWKSCYFCSSGIHDGLSASSRVVSTIWVYINVVKSERCASLVSQDEAEKLFNKLVKDCMNKVIIIDYPFSKSSSLSLPLLPPSDEGQRNHMSPTTISKEVREKLSVKDGDFFTYLFTRMDL
jgi:hypothetical protein